MQLPVNGNQPQASTDNDDHSRSLNDLQNQDIHVLVSTFIQSNAGQPLVEAVVSLLNAKAVADLLRLINQLLSTLTDRKFYNGLFNALKAHVEAHPWSTAFFIIGIVLLCNPQAMAGFRSLGPVANSLATAWQSSMGGTVAARSAFVILQSWGICNDAWLVANAGGREVERWGKGEYGNPVTNWWNGAYGDPVTRWCKGEYGSPVVGWVNSVTKK